MPPRVAVPPDAFVPVGGAPYLGGATPGALPPMQPPGGPPPPAGGGGGSLGAMLVAGMAPEEQARLAKYEAAQSQQRAQSEAEDQATREYQARESRLGAAAVWFAKGFYDALTGQSALIAMGTEGLGALVGSESVEKFGRELGEASSGKAVLAAATALWGELAHGEGVEYMAQAKATMDQQERAWPLLTTVADFAGGAAFGLATGSLMGGAAWTPSMWAAQGAADAAGFGAQWAYENQAPLMDVYASAAIGAVFGGAFGGVWGKAETFLSSVSAEKLQSRFALRSAVDRQTQLNKIAGRRTAAQAAAEYERIGRDILEFRFQRGEHAGESILMDTSRKMLKIRRPEDIPALLDAARRELGEELGGMRAALDGRITGTNLAPDARRILLTVKEDILDPLERQVGGMVDREARRAIRDVHDRLRPLTDMFEFTGARRGAGGRAESVVLTPADPAWWRSLERTTAKKQVGFAQLGEWRAQLADKVYPNPAQGVAPPPPRSVLTLQKLERTLERYIEDASDRAFSEIGMPGAYKDLKQQYRSFKVASKASGYGATARQGNKLVSLTDVISAGAAGAGMLAKASTPMALATSVLTALGNRWLRHNGNTLAAVTLYRMTTALKSSASQRVNRLFFPGIILKSAARGAGRLAKASTKDFLHDTTAGVVFEESQKIYSQYRDKVHEAVAVNSEQVLGDALARSPGIPEALAPVVATETMKRLRQLDADLPRPSVDAFGEATVGLSDAARGLAMIEATLDPLSVFDDLARGTLNHDKASYAWRQHPGLQRIMQAAIVDKLTVQMSAEERAAVPESLLAQLDFAAGFRGNLRKTVSSRVAAQLLALREQEQTQQPNAAPGMLQLPGATPTPVERIMTT